MTTRVSWSSIQLNGFLPQSTRIAVQMFTMCATFLWYRHQFFDPFFQESSSSDDDGRTKNLQYFLKKDDGERDEKKRADRKEKKDQKEKLKRELKEMEEEEEEDGWTKVRFSIVPYDFQFLTQTSLSLN